MTTKTLTFRRLAALTAPALLALSLTACGGGGGGAPDDASKDEFCSSYLSIGTETGGDIDPDASPEDQAKAYKDSLKKVTDKLTDVGTPQDIPDDARDGFEVMVNAVDDLDEGDIQKAIEDEDFSSLESGVSDEEEKKAKAFSDWAGDYCPPAAPSGDSPS
jgi:hypothetical protein